MSTSQNIDLRYNPESNMYEMNANKNTYIANTNEESQSMFLLLDRRSDRLIFSFLEPEIYLNKRERKPSSENEDDAINKTIQLMKNKKTAKEKKEGAEPTEPTEGDGNLKRFFR